MSLSFFCIFFNFLCLIIIFFLLFLFLFPFPFPFFLFFSVSFFFWFSSSSSLSCFFFIVQWRFGLLLLSVTWSFLTYQSCYFIAMFVSMFSFSLSSLSPSSSYFSSWYSIVFIIIIIVFVSVCGMDNAGKRLPAFQPTMVYSWIVCCEGRSQYCVKYSVYLVCEDWGTAPYYHRMGIRNIRGSIYFKYVNHNYGICCNC